MRFATLEGNKS